MGQGWRRSLSVYVVLALVALFVFGRFGYPSLGLLCATLVYLIWHLVNLFMKGGEMP